MVNTKQQGHWTFGSEDVARVFTIDMRGGHLGNVTHTLNEYSGPELVDVPHLIYLLLTKRFSE